MITLARPELLERRPTWGAGHRNFTSIYLEPLSEQAMQELLVGLVPGLPTSLRDQILARAEGVPLYAVETVRMLLDRGLVVQDGASYKLVGEVDELEVPETLHALIAARLDGLSPEERRLLGDAAVLGKTFTPPALAALSGLEPDRLEPLLTAMVRKEVLGLQSDPRSPEQGQYTFLQDLLRHVAYETLPKRERREKHLAAAEHLAATLGEDEVAEVVASHLLDAYRLDPDAADAETLCAAERTRRSSVRASAPRHSAPRPRRGATSSRPPSSRLSQPSRRPPLIRAGEMALAAGETERARELFEQAIRAVRRRPATRMPLPGRPAGWRSASGRSGQIEPAIRRMEEAYAVIGEDEPDEDLVFLILRLGSAHYFAGNLERAAELTERGLDLAEALELPERLCRGWNTKAMLISPRRPEEARGLFQFALDTALAHELYLNGGRAYTNLSDLAFRHDRYAESLAHLEQALPLARRIGDRPFEWFALSEMTYALTMLGRWEEALARFAEIPDELHRQGLGRAQPARGVLELYLHRGQLDEARQLLARYERLARSGDVQAESCYQAGLAAVRLAEGNHTAALVAAEQAFATRETLGIATQSVKFGLLHALEAALALGDQPKANELLEIVEALPPGLARRSSRRRRTASARTSQATIPAPIATSRPRPLSFALSSSPSTSRSSSSSTASGCGPRTAGRRAAAACGSTRDVRAPPGAAVARAGQRRFAGLAGRSPCLASM